MLTSQSALAQEQREARRDEDFQERGKENSHFISDTAEMYTKSKKMYLALSATKKSPVVSVDPLVYP